MSRTVGHRIAHAAIALICLTRAIAYSSVITPPHDSPGPMFLTDEGKWLWAYAGLWALTGLVAIVEAFRERTWLAIPILMGLSTTWGLSYLGAWILSRFHSMDWMTGSLYLGLAGIAWGASVIIQAQDEEVTALAREIGAAVTTGPIQEAPHER